MSVSSSASSTDRGLRLLADIGRALGDRVGLHDPSIAVRRVAELIVPEHADACVIELEPPAGGSRSRAAAVHRDPRFTAALAELPVDAATPEQLGRAGLADLRSLTLASGERSFGTIAVGRTTSDGGIAAEVLDEVARRLATTLEIGHLLAEQQQTRDALAAEVRRTKTIMANATLGLVMMDARQHCTYLNAAAEQIFGLTLAQVQGKPLHEFVHHRHPDGRPYPIEDCPIDRALPTRMQESGEDVFVRPDGTFYPVRFTASPITEHGVPVGTVIEVQEITEERRLEAEQQRRAAHALLIGDVGSALTRSFALRPMLQRCAEAIVTRIGAAFARIWTLPPGGDVLELQASAGMYTHLDGPHARVPVGKFKIGLIAEERQPHLTNSVMTDPRVGDPAWARREGMIAFAGHPLVIGDEVVGVMAMFARAPLSTETLDALSAVADAIAVGVERARAEVARHESETRYLFATRATKDAIWDWNLVTNYVAWNEGIEELFAHRLAEVRPDGDWWIQHIHPDDRAGVSDSIHHAIDDGARNWHGEYRFERADGTYAMVTDRGFIHRDKDGRPIRMVGAMQDVTDRRSTELGWRFLAETGTMLSSTLEPDAVLQQLARASVPAFTDWSAVDLLEPDGTLRRAAVAHSEPAKVELAFELARRFPPRLDDPAGVGKVVRTSEPEVAELVADETLRAVCQDPEQYRIAASLGLTSFVIVPIVVNRRTVGALTWVHAESRRRFSSANLSLARAVAERAGVAYENARLYAELRQFNVRLERRVTERTAELQDLNGQLESFTYSISHDLRAPLRHIGGFAQLLERRAKGLDEKSTEYLRLIIDAAQKGGQLVDDLLGFSRLGRTELKKTPIDLQELVEDVRTELAPEWEGRSVSWQIGQLPRVHADQSLLRSVFRNLLSNALKYSRTRERSVIEIASEERADEHEIRIRDNGVGFDMAYVDKLFGVFHRLHTSAEFEGTGIGLANVRRIVNRHGGRTWGVGVVDQGATFYVTLPKRRSAEQDS